MSLGQDILQTSLDIIVILAPDLAVEQTVADTVEHESDETIAEIEERHGAEEGIPEPEHKVDLLIDNVLRQNAQTIV